MKPLLFFLFLFFNSLYPVLSQSNLLETVKKNPYEARNLCNKFRELIQKAFQLVQIKLLSMYQTKKS